MVYLAFGFVSFYFSATMKAGEKPITFPTKVLYLHGAAFPFLFVIMSLIIMGLELYEYVS